MKGRIWKKWLSTFLVAVMLAGSIPDLPVNAAGNNVGQGQTEGTDESKEELSVEMEAASSTDGEDVFQYVVFPDMGRDVIITVPETEGVIPVEGANASNVYKISKSGLDELAFYASVCMEARLEIPESLVDTVFEKEERVLAEDRWVYSYGVKLAGLETSEAQPLYVQLELIQESVSVKVNGNAIVQGVDENGLARLGDTVSIEVIDPGYTLARLTKDENGKAIYTSMELDYDNRYVFTVEEAVEFYVADPEQVEYTILGSERNKAKLTGVDGLKLSKLESSAQGYDEIVLNFTAVKNASDGTETENVYYEVKVNAIQKAGETLPAGSSTAPKYYYIPKVEDADTQSKSIKVNNGNLSAPTAATYEFSVRMVLINKTANVPQEDKAVNSPLTVNLTNNTITKQFATKNPYFEDKLGFKKQNTKIYTGQQNLLVGTVKYSKNGSYLHDLTAVAYDSRGEVCEEIYCTFKNDNDELYVSTEEYTIPGKYNIVIYASVGEAETADSPQGGTMYQANTTVALTVQSGIYYINTNNIAKKIGVNSKDVTFSAVPIGYTSYGYKKAAKQKFTYEIKSVAFDEYGDYYLIEPTDKVKSNVSVKSNGKVTVKKGYYVDENTNNNYIAVVIKAADYEGNAAYAEVLVEIVATVSVPTTIYLVDTKGYTLGTTIEAQRAYGAKVVVLDQYGNNMNNDVIITPTDNAKGTAAAYVTQSSYSNTAWFYVRKCTSVNIKAVTKDGTKKSKTLKLKITKPTVSGTLYYKIANIVSDGFYYSYSGDEGYIRYSAPKGAVITYRQGVEYNNQYFFNRSWYDWKYEVTGGKLKVSGNYFMLTPTAQTATVKVWSKANPRRTWTLTFYNTNWNTTYEKAPKLTHVSGKLYSNKYSNNEDLIYEEYGEYYYVPDQELVYQYEYGSYDSVRVTNISKNSPYLYVNDFNPETRTITFGAFAGDDIKTGSFKYAVAFYRDGILMCKPTTITVKVNKSSKVKVTSSYTLDTAVSNSVDIKCSTKDFTPDFEAKILNANEGGKANDFSKYFEVIYITDAATGVKKPVIQFKSTVTAAQKEQLKGTTMTGYVKYSYYYGWSYLDNNTAKVSIKIK